MGIKFSHGASNTTIQFRNNDQDCDHQDDDEKRKTKMCENGSRSSFFKVPLHYPKYTKSDYEKMAEWQLDQLLREYGLPIIGDSYDKRKFVIGAFLWSDDN